MAEQPQCAICFGNLTEEPCESLLCGHTFHQECLNETLRCRGIESMQVLPCPKCRRRGVDLEGIGSPPQGGLSQQADAARAGAIVPAGPNMVEAPSSPQDQLVFAPTPATQDGNQGPELVDKDWGLHFRDAHQVSLDPCQTRSCS